MRAANYTICVQLILNYFNVLKVPCILRTFFLSGLAPSVISADLKVVETLFRKLIDNAEKMFDCGTELELKMKARDNAYWVAISVWSDRCTTRHFPHCSIKREDCAKLVPECYLQGNVPRSLDKKKGVISESEVR